MSSGWTVMPAQITVFSKGFVGGGQLVEIFGDLEAALPDFAPRVRLNAAAAWRARSRSSAFQISAPGSFGGRVRRLRCQDRANVTSKVGPRAMWRIFAPRDSITARLPRRPRAFRAAAPPPPRARRWTG